MSSGFSTLSMNDGIGVPRMPAPSRVAMSARLAPPRNVQRFVRFAGAMGWPHSSFSSGRDGPSPRPSLPWHLLHSIASNISFPRLMDSAQDATPLGHSHFLSYRTFPAFASPGCANTMDGMTRNTNSKDERNSRGTGQSPRCAGGAVLALWGEPGVPHTGRGWLAPESEHRDRTRAQQSPS